jgi:GNAT superfamily N-acetyltransferase
VTLRLARPDDAEALGAILSDWIDETPWMPRLHSREDDAEFVARLIANTTVTLAEDSGVAQGFLARAKAEVLALYVAAPARGQGLGGTLVADAKTRSPRLWLWTFQANEPARRFYERQGFAITEQTGGEANDEGLPDIRLEWHRSRP